MRSKKRVLVCPTYSVEGVINSITYYRSINAKIFKDFILNDLLGIINTFPAKYSILVLNNTKFHYTFQEEIKIAYHTKRVLVFYLLPYSPDFNPIKEFFADLKKFIKKTYKKEYYKYTTY